MAEALLMREAMKGLQFDVHIKKGKGSRKFKRYKIIKCRTCKATIRKFDREKYPQKRIPKEAILKAVRGHYKKKHPRKFKKSTEKALETKRKKGLINKKKGGKKKMVRKMRTNKRLGSRIRKKWGKVGAPKSAKRKRWLKKIRKKRKK